ncbi:MAG: hypothetical protein JXB40_05160 [Candidatus Omnitrophica bacterium]|nr:hypothetical protein [Candidatus Omnitrophota bacterium]
MGVIEAIRKGFSVAGKAMALVAVLFVFNLLGNLASLPFAPEPGAPAAAESMLPLLLVSIVFIILSVFIQGGSLGLIRDLIKEGKMKLAAMLQYGARYFIRLLILGIFILAIVLVVAIIAAILIALTAPLNIPVITGIAAVIAVAIIVVSALYFFIPFILSPYAVVCDEVGVIEALKKSILVGRKPFSRVLALVLLMLVLILIALGVGFLVGLVIGLVSALLPAGAGRILMIVVSSAVNSYIGVVATSAFMSYYLVKKESAV